MCTMKNKGLVLVVAVPRFYDYHSLNDIVPAFLIITIPAFLGGVTGFSDVYLPNHNDLAAPQGLLSSPVNSISERNFYFIKASASISIFVKITAPVLPFLES